MGYSLAGPQTFLCTAPETDDITIALVPLMRSIDILAANVVEKNMGKFGNTAQPLVDGRDEVFKALSSFVAKAKEQNKINCELLTSAIPCTGSSSGVMVGGPTSPLASASGSPISSPTTDFTFGEEEDDDVVVDAIPCEFTSVGGSSGLPSSFSTDATPELLGGAYKPTSNVEHIIDLTDKLEVISKTGTDLTEGLSLYSRVEDGVSLKCLSTAADWDHITRSNPLYVIYMYGLWVSDDGDNDGDGYSNKMFDNGPILNYGDTIVIDEFDKKSGYDAVLTAETIRIMNMWMATTSELYRAAEACRAGYVDNAPSGFNPVDFAAALWFGSAQDADLSDGASLYSWAKRAEEDFTGQSSGVNDAIITKLNELQKSFRDCRGLATDLQKKKGFEMKRAVDDITRVMTVPVVQNFIHHLATEVSFPGPV